jgi:hypothetical protein
MNKENKCRDEISSNNNNNNNNILEKSRRNVK